MRVFKTKAFDRFAARENIADSALRDAIAAANTGLIDADLGGGLIKLRIARPGQGKSGGVRTIVAFRRSEVAFFVYGFAKNERQNIRQDELKAFRDLARKVLGHEDSYLTGAVRAGTLKEIPYHA